MTPRPPSSRPPLFAASLSLVLLCGSAASPPVRAAGEGDELSALVDAMAEAGGLRGEEDVVLEHLRGVPAARPNVVGRFQRVAEGLSAPFRVPAMAGELRDLLSTPMARRRALSFDGLLPAVGRWMDRPLSTDDPGVAELRDLVRRVTGGAAEGRELLQQLSDLMATAQAVLEESLAALSPASRERLFSSTPAFLEAYFRTHFPQNRAAEGASKEQAELVAHYTSEPLSDPGRAPERALAVADVLLELARPEVLEQLAERLHELDEAPHVEGFDGDVRAVFGESPSERVVVGGPRATTYSGAAALVIDLGGDDRYERAAVADAPDRLASLVLDVRGDDSYASTGPGNAFALGGVALLVDLRGDDHYLTERAGEGAAVLGVALLADFEGDDLYELQDYGQGHAVAGVGLLLDRAGNDQYLAWANAQGACIGPSFAALVDGEGGDTYVADGHWPDVYGNSCPDCFHGASQGYGTGLRPGLAGGFAALVDLGDGDDRYTSGNFSQGGGYYFSFGLMADGGGDDLNVGSRYSQGFGVHQAIGVRWDAAGDDSYTGRSVAHCGMAWDEGVGFFFEDGGDDEYVMHGALSLGAAAQTGVAVMVEGGGKDRYTAPSPALGGAGQSEYHDKPSLGVFLELGGKADSYSLDEREDGGFVVSSGAGLFLDTRARTLAKALRDKALRQ